ncbi:UDP-glucosyltransferase 29-like [Ziziphus jujuba]|uniref:Glycosyltransferase n=1 Tax=Ziziphus jujuba TaxID=326968 RepID=A0ABM4AGA9_ZIZJJ|nr:UDP-glucosyltransferase 29-like [Ziziphus jujuba]
MVDAAQRRTMKVVMFPWLAHGHITPYLELAKKLAQRNFQIFFCSSPINLNSIKHKLSDHPNTSKYSIELVELHLPSLHDLPPQYHTMKGLPPHLFPTLIKALDMARPEFANLLQALKPDLLIYDMLPLWAPDAGSSLNIPSVCFITGGAATVSFMFHEIKNRDGDYPFPEICPEHLKLKFAQMRKSTTSSSDGQEGGMKLVQLYEKSSNIILIKSFRDLEGKYMDYLSVIFGQKIVPVGPLVPEPIDDQEGMEIINWLDKKEKSSTVFVSFGSECYLSKEDREEMAYGLELSKVNFIWVIRFPEGEKMKLEDALPNGFLERVRQKGKIVEDWAPQVKILNRPSIGGFVSHCGWGSLMESLNFGVPIIAMAMQVDQPWNARLAEVSGIALEIKRDSNNGKIERENVAKVINEVVVEKTGEDIRRKAKDMSENIKRKAEEEMNEVERELLQLCEI